jgi:predicted TIM-barrel fold metal-dependent hydrolase
VGPIPGSYPEGSGIARIARVLAAHPTLNVVVAHMGAPDTNAYFALMASHPRLYLDTTMMFARDSPLGADREFDRTLIAQHADRVLYGTDFPNIPYAYEREHDGLIALGLPAASLDAIARGNARRLLASAGIV